MAAMQFWNRGHEETISVLLNDDVVLTLHVGRLPDQGVVFNRTTTGISEQNPNRVFVLLDLVPGSDVLWRCTGIPDRN